MHVLGPLVDLPHERENGSAVVAAAEEDFGACFYTATILLAAADYLVQGERSRLKRLLRRLLGRPLGLAKAARTTDS